MPDARTIATYDAKATEYANLMASTEQDAHLAGFIALIPKGGRVLDLGCGPASASAHMRDAGLVPDPMDASAGMVETANRLHNIGARLGTFDDIAGEYAGVWANFSLLHAPRQDLPRHLAAISDVLTDGGYFHIGMKTGQGDARDKIDRMYTYVTVPELHGLIADAGMRVIYTDEGKDAGLDGTIAPWVVCRAVKDA